MKHKTGRVVLCVCFACFVVCCVCSGLLCGVVWCYVSCLCGAVLCCAVLCCAVLCCAVLCCAVWCCVVWCVELCVLLLLLFLLFCVFCFVMCFVVCFAFGASALRGSHPSGPCLTIPRESPRDPPVPDPLPKTPGGDVWSQPSPSPDPKFRPFFPLLPPKIPCVFHLSGGSSRNFLVFVVFFSKLVGCEMHFWALCEKFGPSFWSTHPSGSHPSGPPPSGAPAFGPHRWGLHFSRYWRSRLRSSHPSGPCLAAPETTSRRASAVARQCRNLDPTIGDHFFPRHGCPPCKLQRAFSDGVIFGFMFFFGLEHYRPTRKILQP